ncbi:MAG: heme-binding domain-containing protein [bacterium]
MKTIKIIGYLLLFSVIIGFFGPDKNDGDLASVDFFIEETKPNANVISMLENACYDCHSDHTDYPWYDKFAPINYWLNNHIVYGKQELNLSNWNSYSNEKKKHKMEEIAEYVENRWMPLNSYTYGHSDAKLSDEQILELVSWVNAVKQTYDQPNN